MSGQRSAHDIDSDTLQCRSARRALCPSLPARSPVLRRVEEGGHG